MTARNMGPGATNPVPNSYVRELGYVADVQHGDGLVQCTFGAIPAPGGTIVVGQPFSVGVASPAPWGQSVDVASGSDETITVDGYDYLGQPMQEDIVVSTGTGAGVKAFKWVRSITSVGGDHVLAWGSEYGLPYMAKSAAAETLTPADQTTPAATTGDPRGTVLFDTPPDGAADKLFTYTPYRPDVDGIVTMHGARHYYPASP